MTQLPIPFQRHSPTSRGAARAMRGSADSKRQQVAEAIRQAGAFGLTDEECQEAAQLAGNCQRPRRIELQRLGAVVDSGRTRLTRSGRAATVWVWREASVKD